jgi:hypothetical protein
VRVVAALIEAARFMDDRKNADRVAAAAAPTGHNAQIAKAALKQFNEMGFWAINDDGMDQQKLEAVGQLMLRTGAITAGKQPVSYDRLVDKTIWQDAAKLVKK